MQLTNVGSTNANVTFNFYDELVGISYLTLYLIARVFVAKMLRFSCVNLTELRESGESNQ